MLNPDTILKLLLENQDQSIQFVEKDQIRRDLKTARLYNKDVAKSFQVVCTKRVIQPDLTTLPYGYYRANSDNFVCVNID